MPERPHVHSNLGYVGLNIDIFGVSELKWTGMGELNSDDHYIYYFGAGIPYKKCSSPHRQ